jgi:hypothetical protein
MVQGFNPSDIRLNPAPDERLNVVHVARPQIAHIAAHPRERTPD